MGKLLFEIYERVIAEGEEARKSGSRVGDLVDRLTEDYKEMLDDGEMEELKNLIFSATGKAEQEGFQLGVQFVIKLVLESLANLSGE